LKSIESSILVLQETRSETIKIELWIMAWIVRLLLFIAGPIAAWFVARDADSFGFVQMVVATLLIAGSVALAALWPTRWKPWTKTKGSK
jgi:hypothetical protein